MSHASYTTGLREGPAFEYVNRLMQAAGIVFFKSIGIKYLHLIDPFSGFPMYVRMGYIRDTDHIIKQLKRWFATFGFSRSIRRVFLFVSQGRSAPLFCSNLQISSK